MYEVEIVKGAKAYGGGWNLFIDGDYQNAFRLKREAKEAAERIIEAKEAAEREIFKEKMRFLAAHCARRSA